MILFLMAGWGQQQELFSWPLLEMGLKESGSHCFTGELRFQGIAAMDVQRGTSPAAIPMYRVVN